jgi:hypothetical protein
LCRGSPTPLQASYLRSVEGRTASSRANAGKRHRPRVILSGAVVSHIVSIPAGRARAAWLFRRRGPYLTMSKAVGRVVGRVAASELPQACRESTRRSSRRHKQTAPPNSHAKRCRCVSCFCQPQWAELGAPGWSTSAHPTLLRSCVTYCYLLALPSHRSAISHPASNIASMQSRPTSGPR